jgi:hypothetical protein
MRLVNKICFCCNRKKLIIANDDVCRGCVAIVNFISDVNNGYNYDVHMMIVKSTIGDKWKERPYEKQSYTGSQKLIG